MFFPTGVRGIDARRAQCFPQWGGRLLCGVESQSLEDAADDYGLDFELTEQFFVELSTDRPNVLIVTYFKTL